jgi:hypothetical protein
MKADITQHLRLALSSLCHIPYLHPFGSVSGEDNVLFSFPNTTTSSTSTQKVDSSSSSSSSSSNAWIGQVESLQQINNSACGYYALWNATNLVLAACSASEERAIAFIHNLHSPAAFWIHYIHLQRQLLTKARTLLASSSLCSSTPTYPWNEPSIRLGIMVRSHFLSLSFC